MKLLVAFASIASVLGAANLRQQQFKPCSMDNDCNGGFFCKPVDDGTFSMCQPGNRAPVRNFVCATNSDLVGSDIADTHTGFDGCMDTCKRNPGCNAFAWVKDNDGPQGMCYMKQLVDPSRAFNIAPRVTKSCKEEPKLPSSSKWVESPGYQFQGPVMVSKGGVSSLESCEVACLSTVGCAAVSYTRYSQTCVLHSVANNYYPVWSKAVDLSAVAAVPYTYKVCYGNYDVPNSGDVNNFQGSFQDCAKCMANGNANAFAWYLGPTGNMAQPINPLGTCYCKKINGDVPPPPPMPRNNGGTILCQA